MTTIEQTLEERAERYGDFATHAQISQNLCRILKGNIRLPLIDDSLPAVSVIREAIAMISNKLGRIVNGDPFYADSWKDVAGYCMLVANYLEENHPNHQ